MRWNGITNLLYIKFNMEVKHNIVNCSVVDSMRRDSETTAMKTDDNYQRCEKKKIKKQECLAPLLDWLLCTWGYASSSSRWIWHATEQSTAPCVLLENEHHMNDLKGEQEGEFHLETYKVTIPWFCVNFNKWETNCCRRPGMVGTDKMKYANMTLQ